MLQGIQGCIYLTELVFLLEKYPDVELLDCMVVPFLVFWGNSMLFSMVVVPIYIPTNSARGFPSSTRSPTLVTCLDDSLLTQMWGDIVVLIAFLWWLVMLSIFSYVCWASVCLLEKCLFEVLYPYSNWFVFLKLGFKSSCIFLILTPYQIYLLPIQ